MLAKRNLRELIQQYDARHADMEWPAQEEGSQAAARGLNGEPAVRLAIEIAPTGFAPIMALACGSEFIREGGRGSPAGWASRAQPQATDMASKHPRS